MTSAALVMISALPVAIDGEQDEDDGRPGDEPGGVELVEDVGLAQQPVQADRRERAGPADEQGDAGDLEHASSSERPSARDVAGGDERRGERQQRERERGVDVVRHVAQ